MRVHRLIAAALLGAAPLAAQGRVITVRATDYKFEAPATAPAGTITFKLQNDGKEVHLRKGDCVVQNGTRHAWHNHGTETARLVVFIVGAEHKKFT